MNGAYYFSVFLLRVVLLIMLILCILLRQTALSVPYLMLFFALPYVQLLNTRYVPKFTSCYLQTLLFVSVINVLSQSGFQIFLAFDPSFTQNLQPCSSLETLLREIGICRLDHLAIVYIVMILAPDIILLLVSVIIHLLVKKIARKMKLKSRGQIGYQKKEESPLTNLKFFCKISKYAALLLLLFAGALRPSVPNAVYYVVFLGGATWWACNKNLGKAFVWICKLVSLLAAVHASALLAYQTQFFQGLIKPDSPYSRYFGLTALKNVSCTEPRVPNFQPVEWASYVNPVAVLLLYYILALQNFSPPVSKESEDGNEKGLVRTFSQRLSQKRLARNPTMSWRSGNRKVRVCNGTKKVQNSWLEFARSCFSYWNVAQLGILFRFFI